MQLKDHVAIIAGEASLRGIGWATARRFAEERARVAILDLDQVAAEQAARAIGPSHLGLACDVRDEAACQLAVQRVRHNFGRIDILVNNAGVSQSHRLMDSTQDDYDLVVDVSVRGAYNMSRAVVPTMRAHKSGAIVCKGSVAAQRGAKHPAGPPGNRERYCQCLPVSGFKSIRLHHGCGSGCQRRPAYSLSGASRT